MKQFLFSVIFSILVSLLFGQDAIYKKDNTKIEGKVLEVGSSEIKYKLASNIDGPTYVISKTDVLLITYQNGSHEVFNSSNNTSSSKIDSISINFRRNFIGIDVAEFASNSIGFIYEHTFGKKGMFAVRIPLSIGFNSNSNTVDAGYPTGKIFNTGFDLIYFPTGQGKYKYFIAPYFEWGKYKSRSENYDNNGYIYYSASTEQHLAGGIKNGVMYQPTRHFCVSADLGLGIHNQDAYYSSNGNSSTVPQFKFNINIGYKF